MVGGFAGMEVAVPWAMCQGEIRFGLQAGKDQGIIRSDRAAWMPNGAPSLGWTADGRIVGDDDREDEHDGLWKRQPDQLAITVPVRARGLH